MTLKREDAIELVKKHVSTQNLIKHMIAVGAIMKGLAEKLGEDPNTWEIVGILHDIDYDITKDNPKMHALEAEKILKGIIDDELIEAIKKHNFENNGSGEPQKPIEIALITADALSGLIVATALVMPNKKLEEVRVSSVLNKFKDKSFARRVSREKIMYCEKLGLTLEETIEIALKAMKKVASELGL